MHGPNTFTPNSNLGGNSRFFHCHQLIKLTIFILIFTSTLFLPLSSTHKTSYISLHFYLPVPCQPSKFRILNIEADTSNSRLISGHGVINPLLYGRKISCVQLFHKPSFLWENPLLWVLNIKDFLEIRFFIIFNFALSISYSISIF